MPPLCATSRKSESGLQTGLARVLLPKATRATWKRPLRFLTRRWPLKLSVCCATCTTTLWATGVHGRSVADEFKEHADSEREHADLIAERIDPTRRKTGLQSRSLLERSVSQYVEGETLAERRRSLTNQSDKSRQLRQALPARKAASRAAFSFKKTWFNDVPGELGGAW